MAGQRREESGMRAATRWTGQQCEGGRREGGGQVSGALTRGRGREEGGD